MFEAIMNVFMLFYDCFWTPSVWLPPNTTWSDFHPSNCPGYPYYRDIYTYPALFGALLIFVRYYIAEPYVIRPIAKYLGIKVNDTKQSILENYYHGHKANLSKDLFQMISKKHNIPISVVERSLMKRAKGTYISTLSKFTDCFWEFSYYSFFLCMGIYQLKDRPWLWDEKLCYQGFPRQPLDNGIWWYYMISTSFYLSMVATFFFQHRRKDAVQMFMHHIVTLILLYLSWIVNLVRMGSLILLIHECADIPLNFAKLCGYVKKPMLMDISFVLFLVIWVATRLGLFPFWLLKSTLFEAHVIVDMWYPIYYIFNGLLIILLMFHIFWTVLIVKTFLNRLKVDQIEDVRSDSEFSSSEQEDYGSKKKECVQNGKKLQ